MYLHQIVGLALCATILTGCEMSREEVHAAHVACEKAGGFPMDYANLYALDKISKVKCFYD